MYLLDTDHIVFLQRQTQPEFGRLDARMRPHSVTDFFFSIISLHEQVMGWNTYIHRAPDMAGVVRGYLRFQQILTDFSAAQVLPFDQAAGDQFDLLRTQRIRIGTMDLRIAAIALVHDMTVLTRNVRDFNQVPGLKVEDWTL